MTDGTVARTVDKSLDCPATIPCAQVTHFADPPEHAGSFLSDLDIWETSREQAHFPAEQPASQPYPRIPPPDAYPRRPFHPVLAPPQGPREAGWLSRPSRGQLQRMLSAQHRMRSSVEFGLAVRRGVRAGRSTLVVHTATRPAATADTVAHDSPPETRVGFVVSKAVGNAVIRTRVKRRLRHLVRPLLEQTPPQLLVVVRALPAAADEQADLAGDLAGAWRSCLNKIDRGDGGGRR